MVAEQNRLPRRRFKDHSSTPVVNLGKMRDGSGWGKVTGNVAQIQSDPYCVNVTLP